MLILGLPTPSSPVGSSRSSSYQVIGRRSVGTARGSVELDECLGVVEVMGRRAYSHILVSEDVDTPLIGTVTLETPGFEVDPITGRLREAKIFLL